MIKIVKSQNKHCQQNAYLRTIAGLTMNKSVANNVNRNQNTKLDKGKLHILTSRKTTHTYTAQASGLVIYLLDFSYIFYVTFNGQTCYFLFAFQQADKSFIGTCLNSFPQLLINFSMICAHLFIWISKDNVDLSKLLNLSYFA